MTKLQEKLLNALEDTDRPLTPLELSKIIGANPESVRTRLSKMLKAGIIIRPIPRHYKPIPRYGVGSPPRLQNLMVVASRDKNPVLKGRVSSHVIEKTFPTYPEDTFRVRLIFGGKRDKIHWTVKAPIGLDYYGLVLARAWADSEVKAHLGVEDLIWDVRRYDLFWDTMAIRLEGISIITIDDLQGTLEKYYNKFYGIRKEVHQTPEAASLDSLVSLASGGIPQYQMTSSVAHLVSKVDEMTRGIGLFLQGVDSDRRIVKAVSESQIRMADILDKIATKLKDLEEKDIGP